jgi:glycosyltransferase involved in cell wall biosynthesis
MTPLVSIIVPNYNHVSYLPKRLESIFQQTYTDYEVILLDDASTDTSAKLITAYQKHPKVAATVINQHNSGSPFLQWQKGITLAKGNYIWIAESDDWADQFFLEKVMTVLQNDNCIELAYCASYRTDREGRIVGQHRWADSLDERRWKADYINEGVAEIRAYLQFRNTIPNASAVVFKKSAIPDDTPYTTFRYSGDWAFWLSILQKGKIAYLAEPLNYFRRGSQSLTLSQAAIKKEQLKITEYIKNIQFGQQLIGQKPRFGRQHLWIVNEWLNKYNHFKSNISYYFPNLPFSLALWFYIALIKKVRQ